MRKSGRILATLVLLLVPALALAQVEDPEDAKTFFGANVTKNGNHWESGFWVHNLNEDPVELTYFFAKNRVNAALVTPTKKTILSGAREFIRPVPLGKTGMVGLLSEEQLQYRAVIGIVDGGSPSDSDADDYDELTIVDSSMAYFGGEIADVQAPDGLTQLVVTNFSTSRNSCVAVVYDSTNELVGERTMSMKPTSLKKFRGVVPLVASTADGHGRVEVECEEPFYPQGILQHVATKNIASLSPQPGLVPPEEPGDWDWQSPVGGVHKATTGNPVKRVNFYPPAGNYTVARLKFYLKRGPWANDGVNSRHNICWLVVGGHNYKMLSYLNFIEDHRVTPKVFLRHGIDVIGPDQTYETGSYDSVQGRKVNFTVTWAGNGKVSATTDDGFVIGNINSNTNQFYVSGSGIVLDMGFNGIDNPNEPAQPGWEWGSWQLSLKQ